MGAKHPKRTKTQVEKKNQSNNNFNKTYTYPNNRPFNATNDGQDMAPPPINCPIQQNITPIEDNSGNCFPNGNSTSQNINQINNNDNTNVTPTSQNINQINNNDNTNIYNKPMEPSQQNQNHPQPQQQPQPNQIYQYNPQPQLQPQPNQVNQYNPQPMPMGVAVPFVQPVNAPGMPVPNPPYPMPYYYPAPGNPYPYYPPQPGTITYVLPPGYKPDRGYSPWGDLAEDLRDLF